MHVWLELQKHRKLTEKAAKIVNAGLKMPEVHELLGILLIKKNSGNGLIPVWPKREPLVIVINKSQLVDQEGGKSIPERRDDDDILQSEPEHHKEEAESLKRLERTKLDL